MEPLAATEGVAMGGEAKRQTMHGFVLTDRQMGEKPCGLVRWWDS